MCFRHGTQQLRSSASIAATVWARRGTSSSPRSEKWDCVLMMMLYQSLQWMYVVTKTNSSSGLMIKVISNDFQIFYYQNVYQHVYIYLYYVSVATVHCERLSWGEHGEDPEAEAGPGGEGVRLLRREQENVSHWWHQSSDRALSVWAWTWNQTSCCTLHCKVTHFTHTVVVFLFWKVFILITGHQCLVCFISAFIIQHFNFLSVLKSTTSLSWSELCRTGK